MNFTKSTEFTVVELDDFHSTGDDVPEFKTPHKTLSIDVGVISKSNEEPRPMNLVRRVLHSIRKQILSMFMFYFLVTICFWGSGDFLLSYLSTRNGSLSNGDTLAFISIGNLLGTLFARFILTRWKNSSLSIFLSSTTPTDSPRDQGDSPTSIEKLEPLSNENICASNIPINTEQKTNRFKKIREIIINNKPLFLSDGFKLSFLSGVIGSIAPLGYWMLSVGGGEASTIAPMISLYVIVPAILGLFVLKEKKNVFKFAGIACAVTAVLLFGLGGGAKHWSLLTFSNTCYFMLGFFGWGISYFIRGIAASKVDIFHFEHLLLMGTAGLMFGNYLLVTFVFGITPFHFSEKHLLTVVAGSCQVIGDLGFFLLSKEGKEASKVVPLTGTYILIPSILGFVFLRDSVTAHKMIAILLSLFALVLLGAS